MPWMSKKEHRAKAHFVEDDGKTSCSRLVWSATNPIPCLAPFTCTWVPLREDDHLCAMCARVHPGTPCRCGTCAPNGPGIVVVWDEQAAERWFEGYAERSRTTMAELRAFGADVFPCACSEDGCEGWQCITVEQAKRNLRILGRF